MMCPRCGSETLKVLETRSNPEFVSRKRQCENNHKFYTKEYAISEAQVCEKPETAKISGGSFLSTLWNRKWNSSGS
jgi:transcriptional regulator NrdR family protein